MNAPRASTRVQGGEMKSEGSKARGEDAKVVGKVFPLMIPTTKPVIATVGPISSTILTTIPITRPISKGIVMVNLLKLVGVI